ncbi:IPT/TIG domain-containing protein [Fulvivirga maritima]|uniref:IPT/TIG domain-containing protein n=1 Tax=Fulvivirga maritima TaxID=2904247 RepID=UPI001F378796|nr:IPT/TIG domain-containing protein [Fulvivirga maritima]UII27621.1 IPT/TIG domain-containing protein [Fulvivirga maritima]
MRQFYFLILLSFILLTSCDKDDESLNNSGELIITIDSISPLSGPSGTEITFYGTNLDKASTTSSLYAYFGEELLTGDYRNDLAKAGIPSGFVGVEDSVYIVYKTSSSGSVPKFSYAPQTFKVLAPVFNDFYPKIGSHLDTISISGKYFGTKTNDKYGDLELISDSTRTSTFRVISISDTLIKILPPSNVYGGEYKFKFQFENYTHTFEDNFKTQISYNFNDTTEVDIKADHVMDIYVYSTYIYNTNTDEEALTFYVDDIKVFNWSVPIGSGYRTYRISLPEDLPSGPHTITGICKDIPMSPMNTGVVYIK